MNEFEIELIKKLNTICLTKIYFGELENPAEAKFINIKLPLIFVDFVGDAPNGVFKSKIFFNLYIVNLAYSKSGKINSKNELMELIKKINKTISGITLAKSNYIVLGNLTKLYDAKSNKGYLTLYRRALSVEMEF